MTDNQKRAEELWDRPEVGDGQPNASAERIFAEALDAAEARGRAQVVAKVEALAKEWGRHTSTWRRAAERLRALAAEVTR